MSKVASHTSSVPAAARPVARPASVAARWVPLAGPAVLASLLCLALTPAYRYGIGLDGLSYLTIAQSTAQAEWQQALNAYWSPLYSWLLVPFLLAGVEPLLAATLLNGLVGGAALLAFTYLVRTVGASRPAAGLAGLALVPFAVYTAHYGVFADLLLCALLLAYAADVVHPRFGIDRAPAVRAGVWMGLAYLTKLYALPFVAVHLVLALAVRWWAAPRARRRGLLRHGALTAGVFVAVATPWVAALGAAEGRFTVGTAGGYNIELVAPDSRGTPIRYGGLHEPPPGTFSGWIDPASMPAETGSWSESRRAAADRLVENVLRNTEQAWSAITGQAGLFVPLALVAFALVLVAPAPSTRARLLVVLAALAVYAGGYLVTWVEERYVWFAVFLLGVPAALALDRLARFAGWSAALAPAALAFVLLLSPAVDGLALKWDSGRELAGILTEVERRDLVSGGMDVASADNYQRSAILCFTLDCRYFGHPADGQDAMEQLRASGIERYLVWFDSSTVPEGLELLAGGDDLGGLRLYALPGD